MKRLSTLLGCMAFFLCMSLSSIAQINIFTESFDNGDPFTGNVTTQFNVSNNNNCQSPSYRIGPNLNSVCNAFPNVPAAGNCMSTNEGNIAPATRILYQNGGLNIPTGQLQVSFSSAHRRNGPDPNNAPQQTMIQVSVGGTNVGTINIPWGANWVVNTLPFNNNVAANTLTLTVMNPQLNGDFAIDNIGLILTCIPNRANLTINDSPTDGSYEVDEFCFGDPIFYHGIATGGTFYNLLVDSRPIGSSNNTPFTNLQFASFQGSFNGTSGDMNSLFNLPAGFEYRVRVGTGGGNWCRASDTEFFTVKDCCALTPLRIINVPDCVNDGEEFTIQLVFDETVTMDMIDQIYSTDGNFEYVSHSVFNFPIFNIHRVRITFRANGCSCLGEMLKFDLRWTDCTNVLWLMTDPIPCCDSNCDGIDFTRAGTLEECIIVNGNEAHEVCMTFEVDSDVTIEDIIPQDNNGTCPTSFSGVSWVENGGVLQICGYLELTNPDCEFGDASFYIQTDKGCCEMRIPFSFPNPCDVTDCLDQGAPDIQIIRETLRGGHNVDISIPGVGIGTEVSVTDNKTGEETVFTVGQIECAPWQITQQGGVPVGVPCTGIRMPADINCDEIEGEVAENCYDITIKVGDCVFIMTGDYCDEWIVDPIRPTDGGGGPRRSANTLEVDKPTSFGELNVFPNPISNGNTLMVQQKEMIKSVQMISINGQIILQQANLETSALEIPIQNVQKGMYIIRVQSANEEVTFKRISIVE